MQDPNHEGVLVTPQQMATQWLDTWLTGAGIHGLQPAPDEPLLRWLLALHERATTEYEAAVESLGAHQTELVQQLLHEVFAAQKDTLPDEAQDAIRAGEIHAVRAAETAGIVWLLAALDTLTDPDDTIPDWRNRLHATAAAATHLEDAPAILADVRMRH